MIDKKTQGKKNREAGQRFELKVRKDLEDQELIVDRWTNNIQSCKLVPAKTNKYNLRTTGFPDFIVIRRNKYNSGLTITGVEVKSNGYLSKEEKAKCKWYLQQNIFSKILIISKGKKRGEIVYKEFGK